MSGGPQNEKNTSALKQIPIEKLKNFYRYQHYNNEVIKTKLEWDSLVILPQCKIVINIEVKLGSKDIGNKLDLLEHAAEQTKKHHDYFQKVFGPTLSKDWNFVRAACVPYLTVSENYYKPCSNCKNYILKENNMFDLFPMFNVILNNFNSVSKEEYKVEYDNIIAGIIGYASLNKCDKLHRLIVDPIDYSKETERALTGQNPGVSGENEAQYYMLTPTQINAIYYNNPIMVLYGDFGTGKTYVLKERVKKCAEKYKARKIVYFNLTATSEPDGGRFLGYETPTVMDLIAMQNFEEYPNIRVICVQELVNYLPHHAISLIRTITIADILIFVKHYMGDEVDHIFIDELHDADYSKRDLSGLLEYCRTVCITLKYNCEREDGLKQWLRVRNDFHYKAALIDLRVNMRNCENIVKMAKSSPSPTVCPTFLMPEKNVPGNTNYFYKNIHCISESSLVVAALNKYFSNDPLESVVVLLSDDLDSKVVYNEVIKHFPLDRKILCLHPSEDINMVKEYLKRPEGIFITNIRNFQGAQARNVISVAKTCMLKEEHIRNMILRILSFGVFIATGEEYSETPGICEDTDLHDFVNKDAPPVTCLYYHNDDGYDSISLTYAILNKYFPHHINETVVVFTNLGHYELPEDVDQLEDGRKDVNISLHDMEEISEICPSQVKPENVYLFDTDTKTRFNSRTFYLQDDAWFSSPLASTPNMVIFINDIEFGHYIYRCRNRIICGRPKRVIIIYNKHDDIDKFVPSAVTPLFEMTRINSLHEYIDSPPEIPETCSIL